MKSMFYKAAIAGVIVLSLSACDSSNDGGGTVVDGMTPVDNNDVGAIAAQSLLSEPQVFTPTTLEGALSSAVGGGNAEPIQIEDGDTVETLLTKARNRGS